MKDLGKKLFNKTWNFKIRNAIIEKLQSTNYDVLIIGGGIKVQELHENLRIFV